MTDVPKVALVTGAARRVGRAIALDLASRGWDVALHVREDSPDAAETAAGVRSAGRRSATLAADLARESDVEALVGRAEQALGSVSLLVNNASLFERDTHETATRASWDRHFETNLRAPFVLTQELARRLPEGVGGNVVHLIDHRAGTPRRDFFVYHLTKSALWSLTGMQALSLAPRVRVNAIGPGLTLPSQFQTPEAFEASWRGTPLGHATSPEEIARAIAFLLETPSITGQMLVLDGGSFLTVAPPRR